MSKALFLASALLFMPATAFAQSTAQPVLPGILTTSGCTTGVSVCYVPYSASNPMPVTTGTTSSTVKIDQTTPGTTNGVVVNSGTITAVTAITNALPVGTNLIGKAGIDQTTPGTTNGVVVNSGTLTAVTAITNALPAGSNVIGHMVADTGSTTAVTQATAGNLNATVVGTGIFAMQASTSPALRTYVALDVATVTTGGTAVTALATGHHNAGGFLFNPKAATIDLCINEQATASGTTSAGALTCIPPGATYNVAPAAGNVSVVTSDSSHPFSGQGLN